MTGRQYARLKAHLFPGDGLEAAAFLLAGRHHGHGSHVLTVHRVIEIPYDECGERTAELVTWPTERLAQVLPEVMRRDWAVLKVHCHPGDYRTFSVRDDESDRELCASLYGWMNSDHVHGSLVMLPDGSLFGRVTTVKGEFARIERIGVAGDDLQWWFGDEQIEDSPESQRRHVQAFGSRTVDLLRRLRVGVVGCSGTGSPVVEQLARLGVGGLVLVDPDHVEKKNLNRIINATWEDACEQRPKVEVLERAIAAMGLGTTLAALTVPLESVIAVRALAECDVLFGCMDTISGRALLNRLAVFYSLPYFDVGVRLVADGVGGVSHVCGTVHYLQPDGTSLWNRGVVDEERLRYEGLRRFDPDYLKQLEGEGYIRGAAEDRPAVVSVNLLFASLAVNELLARLHPYRLAENSQYATVRFSLEQMERYTEAEDGQTSHLLGHLGRGDVRPLLDGPQLEGA